MKKDLLLIAHFIDDLDKNGNNRFNYLAQLLSDNGFNVELVTSNFSHTKKQKREALLDKYSYKVTFLHEPAYMKNISIKRMYSHKKFGKNLKKYLKNRNSPDVIYCAIPSLDVAKVAAEYSKDKNIRFIIDIQDLWPEAFKMVFNIPILSNIIFYPMKKKANFIYKSADDIVAVSQTYINKGLAENSEIGSGNVVFIGTDLKVFDRLCIDNKYQSKHENEFWLAYAGTLGHSYDIISVFDALSILKNKGINNIKFIIMGDGPLKDEFEKYARENQVNALFAGRLSYGEMVGLLCACDVAVNPISKGSAASIINKHGDYAAAGLPVLNTQECLEYRTLVDSYQMGLNCENDDARDLAEKLLAIYTDKKRRFEMAENSRKLAEELFDRNKTYQEIVNLVER